MKKMKQIIALVATVFFLLSSQVTIFAENESVAGKTAAYYIQAVIDRLEKDYRFGADKEAMYQAVLNYVMNENPQLLEGSIDVVVDTLDKHSDYMTRAELEAFVNGVESEVRVISGALVVATDSTTFEFSLIDAGTKSLDGIPADTEAIVSGIIDDPLSYTRILDFYITDNSGNNNSIEDLGKTHGWGGTAKQYAGAKIDVPIGNYVCVFFMTNVSSPTIKFSQGDDSYTIPQENVFYNTGSIDSGYGYAYLCIDTLDGFDISENLDSVSIYDGDKLCASYVDPVDYGEDIGLFVCIGAVVIGVLVVLLYVILNKKGGMR